MNKKSSWEVWYLRIGIILIIIGAFNMYFFYDKPRKTDVAASGVAEIGKKAPDFNLADVDPAVEKHYTLSGCKGRPVVVVFWETFCSPCLRELKGLNEIYQKYEKDGLIILAITKSDWYSAGRFKKNNNIEFSFLLDDRGLTFKKYGVTAIPKSFFIDRQGIIRDIKLGYSEGRKKEYEEQIKKLF